MVGVGGWVGAGGGRIGVGDGQMRALGWGTKVEWMGEWVASVHEVPHVYI